MEDFIDALEQKSLEKLRSVPKSDLHNHFVLGGNRDYLYRKMGKRINPLIRRLSSMDEMHTWNQKNMTTQAFMLKVMDGITQTIAEISAALPSLLEKPEIKEILESVDLNNIKEIAKDIDLDSLSGKISSPKIEN